LSARSTKIRYFRQITSSSAQNISESTPRTFAKVGSTACGDDARPEGNLPSGCQARHSFIA